MTKPYCFPSNLSASLWLSALRACSLLLHCHPNARLLPPSFMTDQNLQWGQNLRYFLTSSNISATLDFTLWCLIEGHLWVYIINKLNIAFDFCWLKAVNNDIYNNVFLNRCALMRFSDPDIHPPALCNTLPTPQLSLTNWWASVGLTVQR